jgi:hypothetical protein
MLCTQPGGNIGDFGVDRKDVGGQSGEKALRLVLVMVTKASAREHLRISHRRDHQGLLTD